MLCCDFPLDNRETVSNSSKERWESWAFFFPEITVKTQAQFFPSALSVSNVGCTGKVTPCRMSDGSTGKHPMMIN